MSITQFLDSIITDIGTSCTVNTVRGGIKRRKCRAKIISDSSADCAGTKARQVRLRERNKKCRSILSHGSERPVKMSHRSSPAKAYDFLLKFLLVGDSDVGKGEILASLQDGATESPYGYNMGESFKITCKMCCFFVLGEYFFSKKKKYICYPVYFQVGQTNKKNVYLASQKISCNTLKMCTLCQKIGLFYYIAFNIKKVQGALA